MDIIENDVYSIYNSFLGKHGIIYSHYVLCDLTVGNAIAYLKEKETCIFSEISCRKYSRKLHAHHLWFV